MRSAPLDGVRALAVVAVLLYHAHYPWARGGYLGVDVFFVLSGYLITGVLLSTHRSWWGYRDFLVRRAVRLLPALLAALVGVTVLVLAVGTSQERSALLPCTTTSVSYLMNLPVLRSSECPGMWHVTWSLAAEQQFYVVWPLLLAGLAAVAVSLRRRSWARRLAGGEAVRRRREVLLTSAGLAAAALWLLSVGWQAYLLSAGATISRVAFAPDGRSLVLLLGCALALLTAGHPPTRPLLRGGWVDAAAAGAVLVLVVCVLRGELVRGPGGLVPLVTAGLASVVLVRAAATAGPLTARLLGGAPVAWLGRVSYSLYLWHEVAYRLAEMIAPRGSATAETLRFVLALALAATSYRWVEQPVHRWWRRRGVSGEGVDAGAGRRPSSRSRLPRPSQRQPAAAQPSTPAGHR